MRHGRLSFVRRCFHFTIVKSREISDMQKTKLTDAIEKVADIHDFLMKGSKIVDNTSYIGMPAIYKDLLEIFT